MRTISILAFVCSLGLAQVPPITGPEHTFVLTYLTSSADLTVVATAVNTILDIPNVQPNAGQSSLTVQASTEKLVATQWLLDQLDQAPGTGPAVSPDYQTPAFGQEIIRVFRFPSATPPARLNSLGTLSRTIIDAQRLALVGDAQALIMRTSLDKLNAEQWLVGQLMPAGSQAPKDDSGGYTMPPDPASQQPDPENQIIHVLRLAPGTANQDILTTITAIRTTLDVQRLLPAEWQQALVMKTTVTKAKAADWLVQDLFQSTHAGNTSDFKIPSTVDPKAVDESLRIFYIPAAQTDLTGLATQIRQAANVPRVMPVAFAHAIVMRGSSDQLATASLVVQHFTASAPNNPPLK